MTERDKEIKDTFLRINKLFYWYSPDEMDGAIQSWRNRENKAWGEDFFLEDTKWCIRPVAIVSYVLNEVLMGGDICSVPTVLNLLQLLEEELHKIYNLRLEACDECDSKLECKQKVEKVKNYFKNRLIEVEL